VSKGRKFLRGGDERFELAHFRPLRNHFGVIEHPGLGRGSARKSALLDRFLGFDPLDERPRRFLVRARIGDSPAPAAVEAAARIGRTAGLADNLRGLRIIKAGKQNIERDETIGLALSEDVGSFIEAEAFRTRRTVLGDVVLEVLDRLYAGIGLERRLPFGIMILAAI